MVSEGLVKVAPTLTAEEKKQQEILQRKALHDAEILRQKEKEAEERARQAAQKQFKPSQRPHYNFQEPRESPGTRSNRFSKHPSPSGEPMQYKSPRERGVLDRVAESGPIRAPPSSHNNYREREDYYDSRDRYRDRNKDRERSPPSEPSNFGRLSPPELPPPKMAPPKAPNAPTAPVAPVANAANGPSSMMGQSSKGSENVVSNVSGDHLADNKRSLSSIGLKGAVFGKVLNRKMSSQQKVDMVQANIRVALEEAIMRQVPHEQLEKVQNMVLNLRNSIESGEISQDLRKVIQKAASQVANEYYKSAIDKLSAEVEATKALLPKMEAELKQKVQEQVAFERQAIKQELKQEFQEWVASFKKETEDHIASLKREVKEQSIGLDLKKKIQEELSAGHAKCEKTIRPELEALKKSQGEAQKEVGKLEGEVKELRKSMETKIENMRAEHHVDYEKLKKAHDNLAKTPRPSAVRNNSMQEMKGIQSTIQQFDSKIRTVQLQIDKLDDSYKELSQRTTASTSEIAMSTSISPGNMQEILMTIKEYTKEQIQTARTALEQAMEARAKVTEDNCKELMDVVLAELQKSSNSGASASNGSSQLKEEELKANVEMLVNEHIKTQMPSISKAIEDAPIMNALRFALHELEKKYGALTGSNFLESFVKSLRATYPQLYNVELRLSAFQTKLAALGAQKEEIKREVKQDVKEEIKQELKQEIKPELKQEIKHEVNQDVARFVNAKVNEIQNRTTLETESLKGQVDCLRNDLSSVQDKVAEQINTARQLWDNEVSTQLGLLKGRQGELETKDMERKDGLAQLTEIVGEVEEHVRKVDNYIQTYLTVNGPVEEEDGAVAEGNGGQQVSTEPGLGKNIESDTEHQRRCQSVHSPAPAGETEREVTGDTLARHPVPAATSRATSAAAITPAPFVDSPKQMTPVPQPVEQDRQGHESRRTSAAASSTPVSPKSDRVRSTLRERDRSESAHRVVVNSGSAVNRWKAVSANSADRDGEGDRPAKRPRTED